MKSKKNQFYLFEIWNQVNYWLNPFLKSTDELKTNFLATKKNPIKIDWLSLNKFARFIFVGIMSF